MSSRIIAIILSLTALGLSACQGDRLKSSSVGTQIVSVLFKFGKDGQPNSPMRFASARISPSASSAQIN